MATVKVEMTMLNVKVKYQTLCPTWDETLIFDDIVVHGLREDLIRNPPVVIVEIYDHDVVVSRQLNVYAVARHSN